MTWQIVFRPQAELDIAEAAEWYESQGFGLSADFLRAFDACIASIERNTIGENEILVVACMHVRRDPKRWRDRL